MHVLITGASSGLGAALALAYAQSGTVLSLCGRDSSRLDAVAALARAQGAIVRTIVADVTDAWDMEDWIVRADIETPLDLVIANAGISAGTGRGEETKAQALTIFETNVDGVLNTVYPALAAMKKRGRGQIALMASLAGFVGFPGAPAYSASKAAVRVYGEALRGEMAGFGVKINVICPGFVKTPMTDVNDFKMPFLMSAEKAAKIIKKGLAKNKARIAFPWVMTALVLFFAGAPGGFVDALVRRLPRKP